MASRDTVWALREEMLGEQPPSGSLFPGNGLKFQTCGEISRTNP